MENQLYVLSISHAGECFGGSIAHPPWLGPVDCLLGVAADGRLEGEGDGEGERGSDGLSLAPGQSVKLFSFFQFFYKILIVVLIVVLKRHSSMNPTGRTQSSWIPGTKGH